MKKIAIFGGTFNPVHWGHLLIAEAAFDQFLLDQVIWVPSYHPPHKSPDLLAFEHRFKMVQLAIADHPGFAISDIETQRSGQSYAIDTLQALQSLHPAAAWHWIIGLDAFCTLPHWKSSYHLAESCIWLVAPRKPDATEGQNHQTLPSSKTQFSQNATETTLTALGQVAASCLPSVQFKWHLLQVPEIGISSSLVRRYCSDRRSIRYLIPDPVRTYILSKNLYQN
jgi:nicotinate-nucleotide adenylyltransferase